MILVEGEFNALSLWQATPFDTVSFGSENLTLKTLSALRQVEQTYQQVFVWADKPAVTQTVADALQRRAVLIQSDQDANEWLQQGQLGEFVARQR